MDNAFLAAIDDQPDDDLPRLVYADQLDERGDPRGELIRIQCALACMDELHPDRPQHEKRLIELFRVHGKQWRQQELPSYRPLRRWGTGRIDYWRGFIDVLGDSLQHMHPNLNRINRKKPRALGVLQIDQTNEDYESDEEMQQSPQQLVDILQSDIHTTLRHLILSHDSEAPMPALNDESINAILDTSRLKLDSVWLCDAGFAANELVHAAASKKAAQPWRRLATNMHNTNTHLFWNLANRDLFPQLTELELHHAALWPGLATTIANPELTKRLRAFVLNDVRTPYHSLITVFGAPFPEARLLDASNSVLTPSIVRTMADNTSYAQLQTLSLDHTNIRIDSLRRILRASWARNLRGISLQDNILGIDTADLLVEDLPLTQLEALDLRETKLNDAAVTKLVRSPSAAKLRSLRLSDPQLTAEGLHAVLTSPHMGNLHTLEFSVRRMKEKTLDLVLDGIASLPPSLRLVIMNTRMTAEHVAQAQSRGIVIARSCKSMGEDTMANPYIRW